MSGWQDIVIAIDDRGFPVYLMDEDEEADAWSEELADQRASEPRMTVRRADGQIATIRRVLDQEDLDRYGAEELVGYKGPR